MVRFCKRAVGSPPLHPQDNIPVEVHRRTSAGSTRVLSVLRKRRRIEPGMHNSTMRHVRVLCGGWERALGNGVVIPTQRSAGASCAVFLDPPYRPHMRHSGAYGAEDERKKPLVDNDAVETWCRENGDHPGMKIILAGLAGEYELPGWRQTEWRAPMASPDNRDAERLWLSPHCLDPTEATLF